MLILGRNVEPYLGPYALVGHTLVNGSATTPAIDTTNGKFAVVAGASTTAVTFTDNQGSIFTPLTTISTLHLAYCVDLQGTGLGHIFSMSSASSPSICVSVWSYTGVAPALDQTNQSTQVTQMISPGIINPTTDGQLLIMTASKNGIDGASILTINNRFTITDQHPWTGAGLFLGMAYLLQPRARRINPRWTFSVSSAAASIAAIASFG